jgi:outer membrane beta-barrel protein
MDTRFRHLLLSCAALFSVSAFAQQTDNPDTVITPQPERREISEANIDSENFEIALFAGVISIEDFSSSAMLSARLAYHIHANFFVEAAYAQATAGDTSFEVLSGGVPLLSDDDRQYRYYNLSLGYNLNGETFLSDSLVLNSSTYFTLGAGSTEFAGDEHFTVSLGAGYRLLLTDYLSVRLELRDQLFNSEIIGQSKTTHNIEYGLGLSVFF